MKYILDTNICIYAIKNKPPQVLMKFQERLKDGLCTSAITLAELEHGVEKSMYPEKNAVVLIQFLSVLDYCPLIIWQRLSMEKDALICKNEECPLGQWICRLLDTLGLRVSYL